MLGGVVEGVSSGGVFLVGGAGEVGSVGSSGVVTVRGTPRPFSLMVVPGRSQLGPGGGKLAMGWFARAWFMKSLKMWAGIWPPNPAPGTRPVMLPCQMKVASWGV